MKMKKKCPVFYGWIIAASCFLLMAISIGIGYNIWSVFVIPICRDLNISRQLFSVFQALISVGAIIGTLCAKRTTKRFGEKAVMCTAAAILPLMLLVIAKFASLAYLYLCGLIIGLFLPALSFYMVAILISNWFIKRRGTITGLSFMGSGIGGMILLPLAERWIRLFGWQQALVILAGITALTTIPICFVLIVVEPKQKHMFPDNDRFSSKTDYTEESPGKAYSKSEIDGTFWLFAIFIIGTNLLALVSTTTTPHLCDSGFSSASAARVHSYAMLFIAVMRTTNGFICDRIGVLHTMFLFALLAPIVCVGLLFARGLPIAPLLIAIGAGAANSISVDIPLMVEYLFGEKSYRQLYGIATALGDVTGVMTSLLCGTIYSKTGSYNPAYVSILVIAVSGYLCMMMCVRIKRKGKH